ncbi:MAG TPA: response regulator transcription factor [Mycobacteriales bacterium]|nr:response regulator transcription factor [Mycobacteriales bacterium]
MPPYRVVVADDQDLIRAGFSMILDAQPDLTVVGEAADGVEAVAVGQEQRPDLVLMDIRMPRMDGIEATRRICADTDARVLVLTTFDLDEYVYDALRAGASGFVLKDIGREGLLEAVRVVAAGDALLAPSITRRLISDLVQRPPGAPRSVEPEGLTGREVQILRLLGRGLSNSEIAAELVVSEHTIKTHVSNVLSKLNLRDRVQAVVYAYESGLLVAGQSQE